MNGTSNYTPIHEIDSIYNTLRQTFKSGKTRPLAYRQHQLLQLARLGQENADALAKSLEMDLGRPAQEAYMAEVGSIVGRSVQSAEKLEEWAAPEDKTSEVPEWQKSWRPRVERAPKGVALIIAPWNYPIILSLQPLYGAIAAGCPAVLKPSEIAPHYANLIAELVPKYLDTSAYRVVNGAIPETSKLLELKWDHIFYTGNGRVGRIISAAAAKHLTPLTLELGGKSPVIIDPKYNIDLAAKRLLWGKMNNAGQLCVAPDYIVATPATVPLLVEALKKYITAFYPDGALESDSFSRIVTEAHFDRLKDMLKKTRGRIVAGGKVEESNVAAKKGKKRGMEPTVVVDVEEGDILLDSEIFGPILPIITVEDLDAAIDFVNARDHSLVLYAFTDDDEIKQKILTNTMSGNVAFNDTFQQLAVNELPFGGVGESGHGRQIMQYSYQAFSYERSVVDVPQEVEPFFGFRYAPYNETGLSFMKSLAQIPIPHSEAPIFTPRRSVPAKQSFVDEKLAHKLQQQSLAIPTTVTAKQ